MDDQNNQNPQEDLFTMTMRSPLVIDYSELSEFAVDVAADPDLRNARIYTSVDRRPAVNGMGTATLYLTTVTAASTDGTTILRFTYAISYLSFGQPGPPDPYFSKEDKRAAAMASQLDSLERLLANFLLRFTQRSASVGSTYSIPEGYKAVAGDLSGIITFDLESNTWSATQ